MMNDTHTTQNFKAAKIAEKFETTLAKLNDVLIKADKAELVAIHEKMQEKLNQYHQQGFLTVAFVGQYSAGKSTIISALTGRRDIHIGSDITTDRTASYDWNGIKVIDTPGLFTDRKDHDAITYEAIRQGDLLVFCLTYMLFDSITVENFKKLAYAQGYRWKMMLVVNKMSDGAGEEEDLIANYSESLAAALNPHNLDEFPLCFMDAKDYCEGVDQEEDFLLEISRFQTFIDALNTFVDKRGVLIRFDTPVRIVLGYLDEAQLSLMRDSNEDSAFLELLNRFSRIVRKERDRFQIKIKGIVLKLSAGIANEGTRLAAQLGKLDKEVMEIQLQNLETNVQAYCQVAASEMEGSVQIAAESLQQEIKNLLQGDLAKAFEARLGLNQKISTPNVDSNVNTPNVDPNVNTERLKQQVAWLQDIGEVVETVVSRLTTGRIPSAGHGFLKASNVAGSQLHKSVYWVGKLLNFKFAPWQAVNLAKNIGNTVKIAGPVIGAVLVGFNIFEKIEEDKKAQELSDARLQITSQFQAIAKDLETQVEAQIEQVKEHLYGEIENKIVDIRQKEEEEISFSNKWLGEIVTLRQEFFQILQDLKHSNSGSF